MPTQGSARFDGRSNDTNDWYYKLAPRERVGLAFQLVQMGQVLEAKRLLGACPIWDKREVEALRELAVVLPIKLRMEIEHQLRLLGEMALIAMMWLHYNPSGDYPDLPELAEMMRAALRRLIALQIVVEHGAEKFNVSTAELLSLPKGETLSHLTSGSQETRAVVDLVKAHVQGNWTIHPDQPEVQDEVRALEHYLFQGC